MEEQSFPWGEFTLVMLQVVGALLGVVLAVVVIFCSVIALTTGITRLALRLGMRTAKIVRWLLIASIVVVPPVVTYFWVASAAPEMITVAIPMAGMTLAGCGSIAAVVSMQTEKVLVRHNTTADTQPIPVVRQEV